MKTMAEELEALAERFSEGWHDGIKIDASDVMLLCSAANELRAREKTAVPEDFFTHQQPWRDAIEMVSKRTKTLDDRDYWLHELKAFDAAYESLKQLCDDNSPSDLDFSPSGPGVDVFEKDQACKIDQTFCTSILKAL